MISRYKPATAWMDGHANTQHAHEVAVLMVFWDYLRVIGVFYFWWSHWIRQSQSDKTVFALQLSPCIKHQEYICHLF